MNRYRCETCKHYEHRPGHGGWYCKHPLLKKRTKYIVDENSLTAWEFYHIKEYGCASHSDFNPQAERENAITELINFDRWFSSHHVCGKYALVGETRQWVHSRIKELREGKKCSECGRPLDSRGKCHECLNNQFLDNEYDAAYGKEGE